MSFANVRLILFFMIGGCISACAPSFHHSLKSISMKEHNSAVIMEKVKLSANSSLISHNAEQSFTPVSCQKVITALFVIKELGEDFRYATQLAAIYENDYVIKFSGDYMLKSADIENILLSLKNKKINGKLYLDISEYQNEPLSPNFMIDDMQTSNTAPMLAAIIDRNMHHFKIIASNKNSPAIIENNDNATYISTVITSDKTQIWLERRLGAILINGTIKEDSTTTKSIAALEGKEYIKNKIKYVLGKNNIEFKTGIEFFTNKEFDYQVTKKIAEHQSVPLKTFIKTALKISDNIAFDSLYLKLVSRNYPFPKWENGDFLVKKFLHNEFNIDAKEALFTDGSGLSRYNRIKPSLLIKILKAAYKNQLFKDALATSEEKASALEHRKLPGVLKAKTGTMSGICCICGYLDYKTDPIAFVIMSNNFIPPAVGIRKMEDELLNDFDKHYKPK